MKISFSQEELKDREGKGGGSNKYLPTEGEFLVRIIKVDTSKTTKDGDTLVRFELQEVGSSRTGFEQITLVQTMKWKIAMAFEAAGFTKEQLTEVRDLSELVGKVVKLARRANGVRTHNGKEYKDWKFFFNRPSPEELERSGGNIDHGSEDDVPVFTEDKPF